MAKVLLINGSPRKWGNTNRALEEAAAQLGQEGIETEIVWIGNKPLRGCIACGTCKTNANGQCTFNDDICNEISEKAASADGFVIGAPVFYGQPASQVMGLVQRMLYSNTAAFAYKPVANVAICRRGGGTSAFAALNMPWLICNCPIVPSQYWNIAYGLEKGDVAHDAEGMQTMRTMARNMAWMIRGLSSSEKPQREDWQPTHFVRQDLINA